MTSALPIRLPASDNARVQILRQVETSEPVRMFRSISDLAISVSFPQKHRAESISSFLRTFGAFLRRSDSVTKPENAEPIDVAEITSRLMSGSDRPLRLVTLRTPKAYRPHAHVPDYLLCYVVETLECGHTLTVYPQADPLIARRRACSECEPASLPQKKPSASVPDVRRKKAA